MSKSVKGKLVYVVGPSGAGKDSVLRAARQKAPKHVWFAHRYITRPADDPSENHIALSVPEFSERKSCGAFCLDWTSHGLCYGLGREIESWISSGHHVVVNGSRAAIQQALNRFPDLIPVLITADDVVIRQRLLTRGRETAEVIDQRIERNRILQFNHSALVTIFNQGSLDAAAEQLLEALPDLII